MRDALRAVGLLLGMVALTLGCAQDKYKMRPKFPEEYTEVPNEARYNNPDKANYRKPAPVTKDDKASLLGGSNRNGVNPGGF